MTASRKPAGRKPASPRTPASLAWPDIRSRATAFARDWKDVRSEREEAQTFWNEFFEIFGVDRRRTGVRFEKAAQRFGKPGMGRIDVFWPGTLLAEHKSEGQDLDAAYSQATDYFAGLSDDELPNYVIVSDFSNFRVYDLADNTHVQFTLADLPKNVHRFGFIAGYTRVRLREEPEANIRAVQKLGELHDALKHDKYGLGPDGRAGHPLQMFLVRVLFCLFADDTGLFSPKDSFLDLVEATKGDGSDTGHALADLFQNLSAPLQSRQTSTAEQFAAFPYVNGRLFEEALPIPTFDADMRRLLLDCCRLQWASISPAIFGAMFQKIIELDARDRRRQLGAHYTSEANILKLIGPLFLDELRAEFERVKNHKEQLFAFVKKLRTLNFLDPACGCGNFLVITYRELRRLELDALQAAGKFGIAIVHAAELFQVRLDQFHGIEIEEFPAQVAQVAMWLTEHQMNLEGGRAFGEFFRSLPLTRSANIRHGNALRLDWEAFVPPTRLNYILGNPPFVGKKEQNTEQKEDFDFVAGGIKGAGVLDFVAGWYLKAAQYLSGSKEGFVSRDKQQFSDMRFSDTAPSPAKRSSIPPSPAKRGRAGMGASDTPQVEDLFVAFEREDAAARDRIRCAFVSTNSISQGEQVGVLWSELFRRGIKIQFAHRTFKWSNEAPGKAAVHCVIIGFGLSNMPIKRLFDYAELDGPAHERIADNINPYLADAPDALVVKRSEPISSNAPKVRYGSMPIDDGHLILNDSERQEMLRQAPQSQSWIRRYLGGDEFLNGTQRWCLWLAGIDPQTLKACKPILERVEKTQQFRRASGRKTTRELANKATLFGEIRQPDTSYLLVPKVSSERRPYMPIGFCPADWIASGSALIVPAATSYHFGVLSSAMHMAWMRTVCGRMKSDYQYSAQIVYNNFPWPQALDDKHRAAIEVAAQGVLDARDTHASSTLADLYDPNSMPPDLSRAHAALDRAVDAAYRADGGAKTYVGDADRVAFLFRRYAELTSLV